MQANCNRNTKAPAHPAALMRGNAITPSPCLVPSLSLHPPPRSGYNFASCPLKAPANGRRPMARRDSGTTSGCPFLVSGMVLVAPSKSMWRQCAEQTAVPRDYQRQNACGVVRANPGRFAARRSWMITNRFPRDSALARASDPVAPTSQSRDVAPTLQNTRQPPSLTRASRT